MAQLLTLDNPAAHPIVPPAAGIDLGVYVHIPFCVRKCHYCDFVAGPASEDIRKEYVATLVEEIRRSPWGGQRARTVFFGGGTPSELNTEQLARITAALRETFVFPEAPDGADAAAEAEWTIECNPGTVSTASLAAMRGMGFNRVSLGVQTFHDRHLQALGRIHTSAQAEEAFHAARAAGFRRLNLDLIFALPGQTVAEWKSDLERALALLPEHLSLYNLTIEDKTEFGRRHKLGLLSLPDEDLSADMYEWGMDRTADAGFAQYEISNFALPGEECRHNQVYWRQEPYIGFGTGAASYSQGARWTNTASMQRYLATAGRASGAEHSVEERLDARAACGESIMLALRTREGVDLPAVAGAHGLDPEVTFGSTVRHLLALELLFEEGGRLKLTRRGIMLANAVCAEFL